MGVEAQTHRVQSLLLFLWFHPFSGEPQIGKTHNATKSLGYAQKLSCNEEVVTVGMSEIFDPSHVLQGKVITDNINHDKAVVVQKLRNTATEDESWGQVLVVEREKTLAPKTETTVYAIATNVVWYSGLSTCSGLSEVNGNMARKHEDVNHTEKPSKKPKIC